VVAMCSCVEKKNKSKVFKVHSNIIFINNSYDYENLNLLKSTNRT